MNNKATLTLSTGETFQGNLIGKAVSKSGQLIFTTAMVGYTETLTDPSYFGQIIVFTYPLIGNYGVPDHSPFLAKGFESKMIHAQGVIITQEALEGSHFEKYQEFSKWLENMGIPCLTGLDTRALTKLIRDRGNVLAKIEIPNQPINFFDPNESPIIQTVSTNKVQIIGTGDIKIGLIDCGVKWNILRSLLERNCQIYLLPWDSNIFEYKDIVDGWLISNGPGDPTKTFDLPLRIQSILADSKPVLGICLGFQLISLSIGAKTKRLNYGHRSLNQPVVIPSTKKGYLTSQNHGFEVVEKTIPESWETWFINLNDGSLEGIKHKTKPFYAVQFHPESHPGPDDTTWIFDQFLNNINKDKEVCRLSTNLKQEVKSSYLDQGH
jgi:carbamoyl-phosphate synthase small subunit